MEGSRNNRAVEVTEHIKKALFALIRIIIQQSITYYTLTFKLLQSNITTNLPSNRPITFSNINMTCCGRNNGECVCAKEATCSCGKQPALQCSMPLFLHPHPSCNYCFQPDHRAAHVINLLTCGEQTVPRLPTRTRCPPTHAHAERGLRVCVGICWMIEAVLTPM